MLLRERCLENSWSAKPCGSRRRCRAEKFSGCGLCLFFSLYRVMSSFSFFLPGGGRYLFELLLGLLQLPVLSAALLLVDLQLVLDAAEIGGGVVVAVAQVRKLLLLLVDAEEEMQAAGHHLGVGTQRRLLHDLDGATVVPYAAPPQLARQLDGPQPGRGCGVVPARGHQLEEHRLHRPVEPVILAACVGAAHLGHDRAVDLPTQRLAGRRRQHREQRLQQAGRPDRVLVAQQHQALHQLLLQAMLLLLLLLLLVVVLLFEQELGQVAGEPGGEVRVRGGHLRHEPDQLAEGFRVGRPGARPARSGQLHENGALGLIVLVLT